jgi:lysozyme family protein
MTHVDLSSASALCEVLARVFGAVMRTGEIMSVSRVHRRSLLIGSVSIALSSGVRGVVAQQAQGPLQQLQSLEARAARAGVPGPAADAARAAPLSVQEQESFTQLMPRLLDLIDRADASRSAPDVAEEAAELLGQITRAERSRAPLIDPEGRARPAPSFDSIKDEYRKLFETCAIDAKRATSVNQNVEVLKKNRQRYETVGQPLNIPWYFIGVCHGMECSFNFRTHLHNGDPLRARTVQVPANRPVEWNPPTDWESSASDAMLYDKLNGQQDWSLERTLYRWEQYNGWGYRGKVNSPYLWSFSNQYSAGKYVRDGVWDPGAVSAQCGAVPMLIGLIQAGEVPKP